MRGDKRERILRVMLNSKESLSKNEISMRAGCTRQWVILFLRNLEKRKLLKGTSPLDRAKLLDYWAGLAKKPERFRSYMVKEPMELLKGVKMDYALTTYMGENLVQHFLFPSRIDLYIREKDMDRWHKLLTENGLYGKGNVRIILADEHVMYGATKIDGITVVSEPQLVIDLMREGGPCQEAAEMLTKRATHVR